MDISPYFAELLELKDQVIIPGLGKFYQKRLAGYHDKESDTFFPPSEKTDFITEYHHDDKLVQLISERNNTTLTSAYSILDEYVKDLKTALKSNPVHLSGLGNLILEEDKITLQADLGSENNKDYFGLPPIDTQSISLTEDAEDYSLAQQALNTAMPDDYESEKPTSITGKLILVFIISAIIGGLIAVYYLNPGFYQKIYTDFTKETVVPKPEVINKVPNAQAIQKADSVYDNTDIETQLKAKGFEVEKIQDSTAVSINKQVIPNKNGIRYEIIIYLEKTKKDALLRVKLLNENGINAHLVEDAGGILFKISGATLYNKKDADKELKRIQEEINPQAYQLAIKTLKK